MLPTPSELSYFLEIAATLNISRASERLGITQPTLSLAIKKLEEHVGFPLLIRSATGVTLTRTGQRFQARAHALLNQWNNIVQETKRDDIEIRGSYTIGAHVSVATGFLADVLPRLLSRYTELEIHMRHDLSRRITERVIAFDIDFGIVVNPARHEDLIMRQLYTDDVSFYCSANFQEFQNNLVLCYDPDLLQSQWLLKQARKINLNFRRFFISSSLEVIARVATQGAGIAILPGRVAKLYPELRLFSSPVAAFRDIHTLIYRADSQSSPAAKTFARVLLQELSANNTQNFNLS